MNANKLLLTCACAALSMTATHSLAGAFIGADAGSPNLVLHPSNYTGAGGNVTVRVCISPASTVTTNLEIPLQNVIFTINQQLPTTGNLIFGGANDIPSGALDAESALLHEVGHCTGLAHPNLATESGLPASQRDYTKTTVGNNGSYDLNDGSDNVQGSSDDLRGDDVNLHWFRTSNNNPFTIAGVTDSTTYSRNVALLPGGSSFVANAARAVSSTLGVPNTEAVMQQGQGFDEAQRTLTHDDVATYGYGRSGVDEVAGTGDDYTTTLVYQGITSSGCDVTVSVDGNTGFASCSVGFSFVGGGDHFRVSSGTVRLNNQTNWYYNQTPIFGAPNEAPNLAPIADQIVVELGALNVPLTATDADGGDTLTFTASGMPAFCTLTDNGDRTADIDCSPATNNAGTYPMSVTVADSGVPGLDDTEAFEIVVTPDGVDERVVCRFPLAAIPDNTPAGIADELTIAVGPASIVDMDVTIQATHTYVGDLSFNLEHVESGTNVTAVDRPGVPDTAFGCSGDNVDVFVDDEGADGSAEDTCVGAPAALTGNVTPNAPLSAFDGGSINGTWRLTSADAVDQDTGTIDSWCVVALTVDDPDVDSDGDGVFDATDNCTNVPNANQLDGDGDGYGNVCDADLNGDCIANPVDLGLFRSVFFTADTAADFNGDGVVNTLDLGIFKLLFFTVPGPSGQTSVCQ